MSWTIKRRLDSAMVWVMPYCHVEWGCVDSSMLRTVDSQLMQRSVTDFTSQLHGLKNYSIPVRIHHTFNCVKTQVLLNISKKEIENIVE